MRIAKKINAKVVFFISMGAPPLILLLVVTKYFIGGAPFFPYSLFTQSTLHYLHFYRSLVSIISDKRNTKLLLPLFIIQCYFTLFIQIHSFSFIKFMKESLYISGGYLNCNRSFIS